MWFQNNDLNGPVEEREHPVRLFESKPSLTIATSTLRRTAQDKVEDFRPEIVEVVNRNFYVDDMATSKDKEEECLEIVETLPQLLKRGGFHLTKLATNSLLALAAVLDSERASSMKEVTLCELEIANQPTERTLGVHWDVLSDDFKC